LDIPLVVIALVGDIVDKMMVDPANDLFGGYYPFIRRMVLPLVLILISIFMYNLSNGNMLVSAIVTGFSIGPVFILERIMIIYLIKQKDTKNSS
tara:strand:+ start:797 stop:1078 length:282 start_codon:yes stop_codon:yes gene_type:complete